MWSPTHVQVTGNDKLNILIHSYSNFFKYHFLPSINSNSFIFIVQKAKALLTKGKNGKNFFFLMVILVLFVIII